MNSVLISPINYLAFQYFLWSISFWFSCFNVYLSNESVLSFRVAWPICLLYAQKRSWNKYLSKAPVPIKWMITCRYLMVDSHGTVNQTLGFLEHNGSPGAHAPINTQLLTIGEGCEAQCVYNKITSWVTISASTNVWNNWQVCTLYLP
jgi:hypothetical protein